MCLCTPFLTHVNFHCVLVAEFPHLSILFSFSWAWHLLISTDMPYFLSEKRQRMSFPRGLLYAMHHLEVSIVYLTHPFSCLKNLGVYHQSLNGSLSTHLNINFCFLWHFIILYSFLNGKQHRYMKYSKCKHTIDLQKSLVIFSDFFNSFSDKS